MAVDPENRFVVTGGTDGLIKVRKYVCIHTHIYMGVGGYIYGYIYMGVGSWVHMYIFVYTYTHIYGCGWVYTWVWVHGCTGVGDWGDKVCVGAFMLEDTFCVFVCGYVYAWGSLLLPVITIHSFIHERPALFFWHALNLI